MPTFRSVVHIVIAISSLLLTSATGNAQEHQHQRPSEEEIARLNAEWDRQYAEWQKQLAQSETEPGMMVADLGAGNGSLTSELSLRVGAEGHVYANDIDPRMLRILRRLRDDASFNNITVVEGEQNDPRLPAGRVEAAFLIKVYHQLRDPVAFLSATHEQLAPGALLHIVDVDVDQEWGKGEGSVSNPETCRRHAETAGFEFVRTEWVKITDWKMYRVVVKRTQPAGN